MVEEGVAGVVEATEVLTGDGGMVLLDEVLFEGEAGVVLLSVIMSYDDYEVIVIR